MEKVNKLEIVSALYKVQNWNQPSNLSESLPQVHHNPNICSHLGKPLSPEEELEERNLLDSIAWPQSPSGSAPPNLSQTSDPAHSLFKIVPSQNNQHWYVGDQLELQVQLRDFKGRPKRYGGDLLLARLHSSKYRAGVAGQVLDHENGLYSVRFPLLWAGSAQVSILMVHSSEAIGVLRQLREKRPVRVYFSSVFRRGNHSERTACNICLPQGQGPLSNYTDLHTGEPWYCYKPKMLGCDNRYNHFTGGLIKNLITKKEALLFKSGKNVKVPIHASATDTINVLPSRKESSSQKPDPVKLVTSGYYYQDSWRSLGDIPMRTFGGASAITQCLTNKLVYMYGDSTMGQWFKYLVFCASRIKESPPGESQILWAFYGSGQQPQHSAQLPLPRPTRPQPARHDQRAALHRQRAGQPDRRSQHGGDNWRLGSLRHLPRAAVHTAPPAHPQGGGATPGPGPGDAGGGPYGQSSGLGRGHQPVQKRLVDAAAGRRAPRHVQGSQC
ncbi:NXPE family member 3-like [Vanacampus margaritifer]